MPVKRDSAKKYTSNPISGMGDLFGEPEPPAGFRYIPDVISTADEKSLLQRFEKLPLKPFEFHGHQGNRRIYTFGHCSQARSHAPMRAFPITFCRSPTLQARSVACRPRRMNNSW
jgi:hypothetical protein